MNNTELPGRVITAWEFVRAIIDTQINYRRSCAPLQQASKVRPMLPFLFFAAESLLATFFYIFPHRADPIIRTAFRFLLAFNVTLAGLLHFHPPLYAFYASMVFLPFKPFWVYASGVALTLFGTGLCFPQTRYIAARAVAATLFLIFPANIACVFQEYPRKLVFQGSRIAAIARLPFQATFIAWALWIATPQ